VLIQVPLFYFYPPKDRLRLVFCKVVSSLYVILQSRDLYHWLAPVSPVSERCYMPRSRFKTRPTSCILKSGFCLPTLSPGVSKMLYKQPKISIVLFLFGRRPSTCELRLLDTAILSSARGSMLCDFVSCWNYCKKIKFYRVLQRVCEYFGIELLENKNNWKFRKPEVVNFRRWRHWKSTWTRYTLTVECYHRW